ncbi:hypothetical protein H0H87_003580 [Tephrocybe sp. NHM501043]|nr:hypothetical protein H0H87_003580 [Tephrocybe sp. NHM501043]
MADVKKCMDILKSAEVKCVQVFLFIWDVTHGRPLLLRWYLAGRLRDILRELAFVGDVPLPQRISNSPPVTQKRERTQDGEESGIDAPTLQSRPGASGRYKKQPETLVKGAVAQRAHAQLHNSPKQDFEYRLPPQQQQRQHSSLQPQQNWPHQSAMQPPQKQYNIYNRPDPMQMQPPESLPTFGEKFGPSTYSGDPGGMSAYSVPRAGDSGTGPRNGYLYRMASQPPGAMGMGVGMRQKAGDAGLGMSQPGPLGTNVDEPYAVWSNAPPGFECVWFSFLFLLRSNYPCQFWAMG